MTVRRTELRDDLRAMIAAGRELSPEDDALLADMFLERLDLPTEKPRARQSVSARTVRRSVGAAVLGLALLTGGALVSIQGTSHQGGSIEVRPWIMKAGPIVKILPNLPASKYPGGRAIPVPKDVPLQPKG
jgi:hypothetical protein